jgi:hypothetical protein
MNIFFSLPIIIINRPIPTNRKVPSQHADTPNLSNTQETSPGMPPCSSQTDDIHVTPRPLETVHVCKIGE